MLRSAVRIQPGGVGVLFKDHEAVRILRGTEKLVRQIGRLRARGGGQFCQQRAHLIAQSGLGVVVGNYLQIVCLRRLRRLRCVRIRHEHSSVRTWRPMLPDFPKPREIVVIPPLGVLVTAGFGLQFILNVVLTLFGYLPGAELVEPNEVLRNDGDGMFTRMPGWGLGSLASHSRTRAARSPEVGAEKAPPVRASRAWVSEEGEAVTTFFFISEPSIVTALAPVAPIPGARSGPQTRLLEGLKSYL